MTKSRAVLVVATLGLVAFVPMQAEAQSKTQCRVVKVVQVTEHRLFNAQDDQGVQEFPQERIKSTIVRKCAPPALHPYRTQVVYNEWSPNWFSPTVHTG